MGICRVTGSTRIQNLALRSIIFHSTSCGNKPMGLLNRMGMEFLSNFMGPLMVQSKLFKLVQGKVGIKGKREQPENKAGSQREKLEIQKDGEELLRNPGIYPCHTSHFLQPPRT
eukprot:832880-Pelagomonas_calceolata.AAC.1